jgi:cytosine/adenosine deaminase-related metal-dependent hydrolase
MLARRLLSAAVVYNGMGTARENAGVVVQGEGEGATIIAVDDLGVLERQFADAQKEPAVFALSPAPVNAHTHLDLTRLPYFSGSYEDFIRHVITNSAQVRGVGAARDGVAELKARGTHVVGDIVAHEEVMRFLLQDSELQGVAYWEVIGPNPADADTLFNATLERVQNFKRLERPGGMRVGLSPHTPHTVSAHLLQKLMRLARTMDLPVQIHVAESPHELSMHKDGSGPLREMMRGFLPDWQPSGLSPVQYLKSLGVLDARPTLVHMVHVTEEDVRDVRRADCVVVHCPRSNDGLACGRFPWELYMKHGVEVALGTDSRGSSPDLSVTREVQAAVRVHGERASARALVRAAVKGGYRALGLRPPRFARGDSASLLHVWPD